jgi:cbb3-type cytochrome oxidase maturation protein
MSIIYLLLAISVIVALLFFVAFIISVKNGQYDDTYTPSVRMLFEDEIIKKKPQIATKTNEQTLMTDQIK